MSKFLSIISNPKFRQWLYLVCVAIVGVLGVYGVVDDQQSAAWIALVAALTGLVTASANVTTGQPADTTVQPPNTTGGSDG